MNCIRILESKDVKRTVIFKKKNKRRLLENYRSLQKNEMAVTASAC